MTLLCRLRKNLDKTRVEADEKAVVDVMKTIKSMINPFDENHESLVHLASGAVATAAIADDMGSMLEKGEAAAVEFMKKHIIGHEPNIYSPIKKINLQTFSAMGKKVTTKSRRGEIVAMKNSKNLFGKMLLIAKSRDLKMDEVLKYSLRPFPGSLATSDGDIVKTAKMKLLKAIEEEVDDVTVHFPVGDKACILDGMAMMQTLAAIPSTFGELALEILVKVVNAAVYSGCKRVDFVCDRYPKQSIKNLERQRRSVSGIYQTRIYSNQQKVPRQWKKFMSSGENKEELMKFIFSAWKDVDPQLLKNVEIFLAHESMCHRFSNSHGNLECSEIESLYSDHEEADTRMIAHAKHASLSYSIITIKSPDTDVFVIALNACLSINANIVFETGTGGGRRLISLSKVRNGLGDQRCSSLIGLHAFTGCDTVSAFYGKGKIKALNIAKLKDEYADLFGKMGKAITVTNELRNGLYRFVCHFYGYEEISDVNSVRYEMFKCGKYDEELLPPNEDSLDQHINRANYQSYIWRHAVQPVLNLPNFCDHGWRTDEQEDVFIKWMTVAPAPESLLEFVNCKCKQGCENKRCSCVKASLKCSDLCKCSTGCKNNDGNEGSCEYDSDSYSSPDDYSSNEDSDNE